MAKSAALSKEAMVSELQALATVAGGMVAGAAAISMANKVLKTDASSKLPKRVAGPLAVTAAAAAVSIIAPSPVVRQAAIGAGAAGVVGTMKAIMPNATFLSGLGATEDETLGLTPTSAIAQGEDWVYREPSGHLAFPDLGEAYEDLGEMEELGDVEPPASASGHFIDAPAYLGQSRDEAGILGVDSAEIL